MYDLMVNTLFLSTITRGRKREDFGSGLCIGVMGCSVALLCCINLI